MKIQIDTQQKTVAILENCSISELVKALKGMLGEDYKDYSLQPYTYTYWYSYPWYQWHYNDQPLPITVTTSSDSKTIYNVEIN